MVIYFVNLAVLGSRHSAILNSIVNTLSTTYTNRECSSSADTTALLIFRACLRIYIGTQCVMKPSRETSQTCKLAVKLSTMDLGYTGPSIGA
jgi:hypothetical protein